MTHLILGLTSGDEITIGSFRVNDDHTLDAFQTTEDSSWIGQWAPHAWASVRPSEPAGAKVVPIR